MTGVEFELGNNTEVVKSWQMHPHQYPVGWSRPMDSADDGGGIREVSMCS